MIDLRSDGVTKPSPEMRQCMAEAVVGDDVFGDDPTVTELESTVASLLGKDASLFCASGIMANQISILSHTRPGDEVLCDEMGHVVNYESGAPAMIAGVQIRMLHCENGIFTAETLESALQTHPGAPNFAPQTLMIIESPHNAGGGNVWGLDDINSVAQVAKKHNLATHLDGARLWNAHIATDIPLKELTKPFDSVSVCFSKGLGAPVGSCLVGSNEFVSKGGAMRQAGILCSAALYALKHNVERLVVDHANAKELAAGLASIDGVDVGTVETNIVYFTVANAERLANSLKNEGILLIPMTDCVCRAVTHMDVIHEDVVHVVEAVRRVL